MDWVRQQGFSITTLQDSNAFWLIDKTYVLLSNVC